MPDYQTFALEKAHLAEILAHVREKLERYPLDKREIIQAELFAEEVLIRWMENHSNGQAVTIGVNKRFFTVTLSLAYKGYMLDPFTDEGPEEGENEYTSIGRQILIGLSKGQYAYKNGWNKVSYTLKNQELSSVVPILIALGAALVTGFFFHHFFPATGSRVNAGVLFPLNQAFFTLLNAIAIPFLFISLVASMINVESVSQMKILSRTLFRWIVIFALLAAVIALVAGILYFPVKAGGRGMTGFNHFPPLGNLFRELIPSNIFSPFIESNSFQVIFLAVITGLTILFLKNRFSIFLKLVTEMHQFFSLLLDLLCSLMPIVVFSSLFSIQMSGEGRVLVDALGLIGMLVLCMLVFVSVGLLSVALIEKESPLRYLKKMGPVLLIALSTANSGATFIRHSNVAATKQGIRNYLIHFSIPVGALFSKPFMMIVVFLVTLFTGAYYHLAFGLSEFLYLLLISIVITIAVPPMPGLGIFLFTITLNRFGIPIEGLVMAVTLYTLLDYLLTAVNVFSVNLSMLHTEYRLRKKEGRL